MKKWSVVLIAVHILGWLPLVVLVAAYLTGNLGVNPVQATQQRTGDIAIIMLLLSLVCTPLNTLFGLPKLLRLRRPLGLYAFFYASLHLLTYAGLDYAFNFNQAASTLAEKRYLLAGLGGLSLLVPIAFTSHIWWEKRLGKSWKKLHRLVYLAAILAVLHLAWVIKGNVIHLAGDIWKPLAAGFSLTLLLAARITPVRKFLAGLRFKIRGIKSAANTPRTPARKTSA